MENTATLTTRLDQKTTSNFTCLACIAALYSEILGEEITLRKVRHLLHAQLAGFMLIPLATWSVGVLILGLIWFASALYSAKTEWSKHP
jgi:hypothetical protein